MTPKQSRFVEEYLVDLNATAAARRAGYSAKTADRTGPALLGNSCVSAAVAERLKERSDQVKIDAAWVLAQAVDLYAAARKAEHFPTAAKALELVGKHVDVAAYRDQVDHRVAMTADEARQFLAAMLPRIGAVLPAESKC